MAQGGRIDYTIGFNVDKSGLSDLKKQLKEINTMTAKEVQLNNPSLDMKEAMSALKKAQVAAYEVEKAMNQAFNPKLGITNLEKLQSSLNRLNLNDIQQRFSAIGAKGSEAFLNIAKSALTTNVNLKQTSKFIDKIGTTLINTVKWQFSSSIVNRFTGAIQQAYGYVKHLDTSLNDIRIVTGKSADEMERFAVQANKTAQALGRSTTQATEAALIYYQQGLSDEEAQARMETTLKAANVTGQSAQAVSEELTAVWNGYKVNTEETEAAVDKLAAVAATTASDLQELSTGMSKVASAANAMGVDMDQLNAQIATIISVTRQAPESVGTALKTIYARLADLKLGDTDEDGLGLGDVSGTLDKVGIAVLDANGDLREMGDVIEDVAVKWNTWTSAQQTAIAQVMAGKRQYNNLVALFENWDMYSNALDTSRNSLGTLQNQQDIYMESTEAHIQMLKTEWEDLYDSIIDESAIKGITDSFRSILNIITNIVDGLGGGKTLLSGLFALIGTKFGKQIAQVLNPFIENIKNAKTNAAQLETILSNIEISKNKGDFGSTAAKAMREAQEEMSQYWHLMSEEEFNATQANIRELGTWTEKKEEIEKAEQALHNYIEAGNNQSLKDSIKGKTFFTSSTDESKVVGDSVKNNLIKTFTENEKEIQKLSKSYQSVTQNIENFNNAQRAGTLNDSQRKKSIDQIKTALSGMEYSLKQTKKFGTNIIDESNFQRAEKAIDKLKQELKELENGTGTKSVIGKDIVTNLESVINVAGMAENELKVFFDVLKNGGTIEEATKKVIAYKEAMNQATLATQQKIEAVSRLMGGLSSLVFAFQSLSNIGRIFNDEDLSAGEKFLQITSNLLITLPMLTSGITTLTSSIKILTGSTLFLTTAEKEKILTEQKETLTLGQKTLAYLGLNTAMKSTLAIIGSVALGLGALGFVISKIIKAHNDEQQAIREKNQAIIDEIDAREQERDVIQQNIDSLRSLADQYNSATYSKEEFLRKSLATIDGLDAEAQAALNAAKSYEEMTQAIDDYNIRVAKESIEEQEEKSAKALSNAFGNQKHWDLEEDGKVSYKVDAGRIDYTDFKEQIQEILGEENFKISTYGNEDGGQIISFEIDPSDQETIDKLYEIAQNTETPKKFKEELNNIKNSEEYKVYEEAQAKIKEESIQIAKSQTRSRLQWARSAEDVESAEQEFVKALEGVTSPSDALAEFNKYASGFDNDAIEAYIKDYENKNSLFQAFLKNASIGQISNAGNVADNIDEVLKIAKEQGLENYISNVNPKFWLQYLVGDLDEATKQKIIDELNATKDEIIKQSQEDFDAGTTSDNLKSVLDSAITNSLDVSSEEYKNLETSLQGLKEIYPELTEEIDLFSQTGLVGTEHWIQGVYRLQAAIDKIEFDKLNTKANEARDNLQGMFKEVGDKTYDDRGFETGEITERIVPDDSEFQEAIDNILNAEYEIDVEVHADAERDFTQLVSSLEQADSMADKIGEDFIVAADDIRELNQAFPGILQDIEYLGDGTIKLNEDIARSAMAAAADEEEASTQALITKLQNSATELRSKADIYDAAADIAAKAAAHEIDSDKAKTDIATELNKVESENDKIASQSEIDNAVLVADNSEVNAQINAENWTKSYQEAARASAQWANAAIQNAAAVARGQGPVNNGGDFGVNATMRNGQASEAAKSGSGYQNASTTQDWKATEEQFRNMAEAARQEANDIEGMIVAATAKGTESLKKVGEVGKGSGSGSDSGKEADHEEYLEREEDIYHTINQELEQIESTLGRIQKLEDHSWGASAKANLEEENKLLEKQIEKLHEKKALQERDLSTRRKQLEDVGISFTEDGSAMTNAEAQLNALYAHYNTMVDTYNAMSAAEQETYKAQLEAEKDRIKKIEDKINDYESTFSDYQSVLDEIMDKHFEQIEKQVKTFNNDIEVHLELDKAKEEWNDFWYDVVKDVEDTDFAGQISKSIDALKILIGTTTNFVDSQVYVLTNHLNDTIAEVRAQIASASRGGEDSMFGDDSALSKETLKNYRDKLMEALTTAKGKLDDFSDNYLKMLDAAQEKIDEQVNGWESISSHLDHNAKLIQMISGENSYEALNKVYEQQYKNNLNLIETQRMSKEFWQKEMAAAQARMATVDKDSKAYKTYAEDYKKASENYKKAVADLDKTVEESLEKLETWKKNQLDAINHAFDMALSNNVGLEMMEKEWKLVNEQADRYLDNVERALGMEDLNNEFNKVLDTAGLSIKAQQELNKMRDEEIAKLNQKAKISQFDLDEIKARLEIRKQEIALEEAQRNKSNLRLRRDSQGNYTYQYTGDDSKIEEASEGLMSAKREWYELVKKRNIDLSNSILENRKNLQQELQNLETMYFENDEEKRAAQNEIIQRYADIEKDIMADKEEAKKIFFQGTAEYFNDVENNTILPQWQTTVESLVDAWSNGGEDSFIGAVKAGINKIDSVQQQYVDNTHQILNQAGIDYLNMKENGIDPTIESLEELVETNEDLADTLENTSSLLEDQARALEECEDGYNRLKDAAVDAVREAEATLEQLSQTVIRTNQQVQASIQAAQNATSLWNTVNSSTNPSSSSNSSNNYLPSQTSSTDNQLKYVVYRNNTNGSVDSSPRTYTNKTDVKKFILDALQHYLMGTVRIYSGNNLVRTLHYGGTYGSREMAYLKSGGYTGTWSGSNHIDDLKSGKLAVLHQKELVLNETDTSNVLDAVHLLRSISVDKIAESIINAARTSASVLNGVGAGMMQGITNLVQNSQANDNSYRNTTINADFSGVRSADAIYQALMELENYNMQQSFT